MTSADKRDLTVAVLGSVLGGFVGYYVAKKTHPVVGTTAGVLVGAVLFPGAVEGAKRLR